MSSQLNTLKFSLALAGFWPVPETTKAKMEPMQLRRHIREATQVLHGPYLIVLLWITSAFVLLQQEEEA